VPWKLLAGELRLGHRLVHLMTGIGGKVGALIKKGDGTGANPCGVGSKLPVKEKRLVTIHILGCGLKI